MIRDADALPLDELMTRVREAAERGRTGRLRSSEAAGATITVANLGELGVDVVHGVIYPPQVALVGFGDDYDGLADLDGWVTPLTTRPPE